MKIIDLFKKEKDYIVILNISDDYMLYIEALDEYGGAICNKDFDIKLIKNLCCELLIKGENNIYDYLESINDIYINDYVDDIKEKTLNLLGAEDEC